MKITIATSQGIVVEQIDASEYDLTKAIARQALWISIQDAMLDAQQEEEMSEEYEAASIFRTMALGFSDA